MKTKISIILVIALLITCFSGCAGTKEVTVSYNEGSETQYADELFEQNNSQELKKMCQTMSGNNDNPETRDNFFYYILIKIATIAENNEEEKFHTALDVLDKEGINMEYLYAFMTRTEKHAYVVLRVADNAAAEKALMDEGFHIISEADIQKL